MNLSTVFKLFCILAFSPFLSFSQNCDPVKIKDFPAKDLPSAADRAKLKDQESYKYYYGIETKVDYVKARHLAFMEMEENDELEDRAFEGAYILVMLYANGYGVKKDLNLSIRLACANVGGATVDIENRVEHLKEIQAKGTKKPFDICDDAASDFLLKHCYFVHNKIEQTKREAKVNALLQSWQPASRKAYKQLRNAADNFFETRVDSEVDQSGTARGIMSMEESSSLEEGFHKRILTADKCSFSNFTEEDFKKADKELNTVYKKFMTSKDEEWGTITKESIKATQKKWIFYRDAWVAFGSAHCPGITDISFKTIITKERIEQLKLMTEFL